VSDTVPSWRRCPACGGSLPEPVGTLGRVGPTCPDCGRVALAPEHSFYGTYEAAEYDFDDVTPQERAEASDILLEAGIAFRWDDGYRLMVASSDEAAVDVLFGQVDDPDADTDADADGDGDADGDADAGSEADDEGPPLDDAAEIVDGEEPLDWVVDEQSVEALGMLFDASDRLYHRPADERAAADLGEATDVVLAAPLPFGVNQVLWTTAGQLAQQLVDLLDRKGDLDDVSAAADVLRSVLRDHI
jgi:hypothetical protein